MHIYFILCLLDAIVEIHQDTFQTWKKEDSSIWLLTVCAKILFEPLKVFSHILSSCHISNSLEEDLSNKKWAQAILEKLEGLQKIKHGH